ncbi:MAG: agmatinase [Gemmatimonadaceae bacterium]|nr:agmatinase [Gemmatimonadaceae bacterium]
MAGTVGPGAPTLVGVPWDGGASYLRGGALGPSAVRDALWSPSRNAYTESLRDLRDPAVLADAGDFTLPTAAVDARNAIREGIARLLDAAARPIALGGDHSISYPILQAVRARHARLTIVQVDAHSDLYDDFNGDRYSHACPFARILEEGLCDRLVQVGIRTRTPAQRETAARYGVEVIDMRAWAAGARPVVDGPLYWSIDLDGLDPAHAPGVSHPEPGGLSTREVLTLLATQRGPVVGADVVELNPSRDPGGLSAAVAAALVRGLVDVMHDTTPGTAARP